MPVSESDPEALLRTALGVPAALSRIRVGARPSAASEHAALLSWQAAVARHDAALVHREAAIRRAAARVAQVMKPLGARKYTRIEERLRSRDWPGLAAFHGLDIARVRNSLQDLDIARARRATTEAVEEDRMSAARDARARATRELITALGIARAEFVTGIPRRRLLAMRTVR